MGGATDSLAWEEIILRTTYYQLSRSSSRGIIQAVPRKKAVTQETVKALSTTVLTDEKKGIIFRMLAEKPLYETGVSFGFDKQYATAIAVKNKVYRIYQEVKKDPERYMVSPDLCDTITSIVSNRSADKTAGPTLHEKQEVQADKENDINDLILTGRIKAMKLVHRKIDSMQSRREVKAANLGQLVTAAAILFDKGQIVSGQATENIAMMAKIDSNLPPEQALELVLKMREVNVAEKEKDKKK